MNLKRFLPLLAALALVMAAGTGCATKHLLAEAKPHYKLDPTTEKMEKVPGNKGAYVGVPFAAIWDVATAPLLGLYVFFAWASGYRG